MNSFPYVLDTTNRYDMKSQHAMAGLPTIKKHDTSMSINDGEEEEENKEQEHIIHTESDRNEQAEMLHKSDHLGYEEQKTE